MNSLKKLLLPFFVVALAMGLAACGDSDDDDDDNNDPAPSQPSVADVAAADGRFMTLLTALGEAELDDDLSDSSRTFTVFAPIDDAFDKIDPQELADLLADKDKLEDVLLYHVIEHDAQGAAIDSTAAVAAAGAKLEMLNTDEVGVSVTGSDLYINLSKVVVADVAAGKSIIHAVDTVLMPPKMQTATETIVGLAQGNSDLSILVDALLKVQSVEDLLDPLSKPGTFTVFAPTNKAFTDLLAALSLASLDDVDDNTLVDILKKHVLTSKVDSIAAFASNGKSVQTFNGESIDLSIEDDGAGNNVLYIDGMTGSKVVTFDLEATNGVVHVIDKVIALD